jgi:hypothetical protein
METSELAQALIALGCPEAKSMEMAAMLNKRAKQLMTKKQCSYEVALAHLLSLMKQGWAAKGRGF